MMRYPGLLEDILADQLRVVMYGRYPGCSSRRDKARYKRPRKGSSVESNGKILTRVSDLDCSNPLIGSRMFCGSRSHWAALQHAVHGEHRG
jgi:hypothetical protein